MNNERKDELEKEYLFNEDITLNNLKELEIQEIIYLIFTTQDFKKENKFTDINLDNKLKLFFEGIIDKIRESEELYIAYNVYTRYPHVDYDKRSWIFSKEEYAQNAKDYFMKNGLELTIKKLEKYDVLNEFAEFHRLGIKAAVIDNGQYTVDIKTDSILKPINYDGVEKINIPVTNPELNYSMMKFFQEINLKANYEGKGRVIRILEEKMMEKISKGEYLVPMKFEENNIGVGKVELKEDTKVNFAILEDSKGALWIPAFTDWVEFKKFYDKEKWNGSVLNYDTLINMVQDVKGVNINPFGLKVELTEQNIKIIENYKKKKKSN